MAELIPAIKPKPIKFNKLMKGEDLSNVLTVSIKYPLLQAGGLVKNNSVDTVYKNL